MEGKAVTRLDIPSARRVVDLESRGREVAELARRQRGVITRRQLLGLGVGSGTIEARLRNGGLHRLHRGVYLLGHSVPAPGALELAAVLACGDGAVVSHESAARLYDLIPYPVNPRPIHITVAGRHRSRPGLHVHRVGYFVADEVGTIDGLPITSPARTLLDLALTRSSGALEHLVAASLRKRLTSNKGLASLLSRHKGSKGTPSLRGAIGGDPAFTRSKAEQMLLELVRRARLPLPESNATVRGLEVDLLWREERVVVEFDGYDFHSVRVDRHRDHARDAELISAGFTVIRVDWDQLTRTPEALVALIATALARATR